MCGLNGKNHESPPPGARREGDTMKEWIRTLDGFMVLGYLAFVGVIAILVWLYHAMLWCFAHVRII